MTLEKVEKDSYQLAINYESMHPASLLCLRRPDIAFIEKGKTDKEPTVIYMYSNDKRFRRDNKDSTETESCIPAKTQLFYNTNTICMMSYPAWVAFDRFGPFSITACVQEVPKLLSIFKSIS